MRPSKLTFIILPAICPLSAHAANIIDTIYGIGAGSFENPGYSGTAFRTYQIGSSAITGWTVNTVNVDWVKGNIWNASDGNYSIDMNGTNLPNGTPSSPGGLQTVIPTTTGLVYHVTFDVAGFVSAGNSINPKTMDVTVDGIVRSFSLTTGNVYPGALVTPLALDWQTRGFDFTAANPSTTVSFVSTVTNGDGSAMLLDNVVIAVVPEPASMALFALGPLGFTMRRNRRII